ncbi:hypothetical protein lbkm_2048 [Lachnospiraceae bacterium KM106-2]|nr:hypothetical protein lbkm_2048 [Lachnospiraceae bacterium KM106-2]
MADCFLLIRGFFLLQNNPKCGKILHAANWRDYFDQAKFI